MLKNDTGAISNYTAIKLDSGIQVGEIYQSQNFAAFTDLAYFNGTWYSAFRLGTAHVGGANGQIEILTSIDGYSWKVTKIFSIEHLDLREGKFTIDSMNNKLYFNFWSRNQLRNGRVAAQNFLVEFNNSTKSWGSVQEIQYDKSLGEQFVFWHPTFYKGNMYCVTYQIPISKDDGNDLSLFINDQSFIKYKFLKKLSLTGGTSETILRFNQNDSMYLIVRTETINSPIGISSPPDYESMKWSSNSISTVLASPNFLFYKNKLLITGRDSKQGTFKLFSYDLNLKTIQKTYTFPSGYETGYGGMCFNPSNTNELWITYYSVTDDGSSINLAKINLLTFLK